MSYRERLEEWVRTVTQYPLFEDDRGPSFGEPLTKEEIDALGARYGVAVPASLAALYQEMNGFSFFWRARPYLSSEQIDAYVASTDAPVYLEWELRHGLHLEPLERLLARADYAETFATERPEADVVALTGRAMSAEAIAKHVHPFDRYLAAGNEDGCIGLLLLPGEEPRVVAITDSYKVDPRRPWMTIEDYLALVLALGGVHASRSDLTGMADAPPGRLRFTPEQLAGFERAVFRPAFTKAAVSADAIAAYALAAFQQTTGIDLRSDDVAVARVAEAAQAAKQALDEGPRGLVEVPYIAVTDTGPQHLSVWVTRDALGL